MYVFKDLETYDKIVEFVAHVGIAAEDFPRSTVHFGDRMKRAAADVRDYFARAHNDWPGSDAKAELWKVRTAIEECFGLTDVAARQGLLSPNMRDRLRDRLATISEETQDAIRSGVPVRVDANATSPAAGLRR